MRLLSLGIVLLLCSPLACVKAAYKSVLIKDVPHVEQRPGFCLRYAPTAAIANTGFTEADFARHILHLKANKLPAGFSVLVQPPFVVIGDEPLDKLRTYSTMTVKWAVEKLKQDFFKKDPKDILDIWLFRDETSYEKYTAAIFGDNPETPYGYYSPTHKALIMNIATGGGTLVHEIVHPFMAANFPECPPWFN